MTEHGKTSDGARPYLVFGAPVLGEEEIQEVVACLRSGWIGTGPRVAAFERAFAEYIGTPHAVAVNSGTAALHLALLVAGIGPGDEVITTPLTFCATVNAILHVGAIPVFADIDRRTQLLDLTQVARRITPRTKALLPVHLHGRPCDMDGFRQLADAHRLLLIEDAAHAIEASWRGRKIGTTADLSCFSFYVTKNLTTGEGGMVTTARGDWAARLRTCALHGMSLDAWQRFSDKGYRHYEVVEPGFKYNLTDLAAGIGLHQLRKVEAWHSRRREIWARYDEAFAGLPCERPAPPDNGTRHAFHLYTLLIDPERSPVARDELMVRLHRLGIGTGCHYQSIPGHPLYARRLGVRSSDFPNAHEVGRRTVSLPLSGGLADADVERVAAAVASLLAPR